MNKRELYNHSEIVQCVLDTKGGIYLGEITVAFALFAGLLSFFSPCIFPLMPVYVAQITGGNIKDNKVNTKKRDIFLRSFGFILGFSLIFVAMGATATSVGSFVTEYQSVITKISGLLIIVFGLHLANIINIKFFSKTKSFTIKNKKTGFLHSSLLGLAFGAGWTPCVSLPLSSILLLAGSVETVGKGILLLSVFSMGIALPFLVISVMVSYSLNSIKKINKVLPKLSVINGWIFIFMGLLLYTDQLPKITAWLAKFSLF